MSQRVRELLEIWSAPDESAAGLLCDRHDPAALAYRIIGEDLSVEDLTYGELRRESECFAAALAGLGIGPGDRVATLMGKSRAFLVTLMGIWRLGAVHVPLFTAFAPPAIAFRLTGSGARAVVCDAGQQAKLAPGDHMLADAPWQVITLGEAAGGALSYDALLAGAESGIAAAALGGDAPLIHIYTSGTTGNPKGVVVPLRALASFQAYAEFGLCIDAQNDVFWCAADPGWAYGLYFGVLATFTTGVCSILFEGGFTPETTMAVLAQQGVTNFAAAPTVYRALRTTGVTPGAGLALRRASSAGEPLTPDVNLWAQQALGLAVHDHYGQTEAGMLINNHHHAALAAPIREGSMGHAMPGWTAAILHDERDEELGPGETGRLAMVLPESPLAWFTGYDGDPAKSAEKFAGEGRWYVTGDTGRMDEDGYFHFSARDDDVIIMAGYRIGPFEVESVLATHPAVAESAVIAVPDEVRGEVIEAFVVARDGFAAGEALEQDLQQWVKRNFAAHAYPRRVHFAQAMPKTPSGKIQRFVLKQRRLDELAQEQIAPTRRHLTKIQGMEKRMQITRLDAPHCMGGENPMWDANSQVLHYIDNFGQKVHSYAPATGSVRTLDLPSVITTLVLREHGSAVVTLRTGIHFLDLESGALELLSPLADPPPFVFNDGKVDSRGRFVIGASTANFAEPGPDGGLFRFDPDRSLTKLDSGTHFSNSPCWSPDGKTFYFSDSWLKTTYAYDYDAEAGTVSNRRAFVNTSELGGLPDGATVDAEGLYWVAIYGGGKIAAYRPDGSLARCIDMPVKLVSSVAFGGPGLDRLFVTTIEHGALGEPAEDGAGFLYVIDGLGAQGLPEHRFAG